MSAKKLIEMAMPIKEISTESVRDKSLRQGHISTLHLWWARRPLPVCRAVVFASIVPDPLDPECPQAFCDAVRNILHVDTGDIVDLTYKPYDNIPYTAVNDPMEDNLRNRLLMFIGKFSQRCSDKMIADKTSSPKGTSPKEQLNDGSLIKWESRNNKDILDRARELLWVAYNAEKNPQASYETLHSEFVKAYNEIADAEKALYSITDRHIRTIEVANAESRLDNAIKAFQSRMPAVFDPFAGGAAIPLEAARLGCRSFGNDINPVAYIVERASAEFPQRYGKPFVVNVHEFMRLYGDKGMKMANEMGLHSNNGTYRISNRLSFDVEYYARQILDTTEQEVRHLYPAISSSPLGGGKNTEKDIHDKPSQKPIAYYWARTARCSNPACQAQVPLLRQFYLANTSNKHVYLKPIINGTDIQFQIVNGTYDEKLMPGWTHRGNLTCPCCGSVTNVNKVKEDFRAKKTGERMIAVITEDDNGKYYRLPYKEELAMMNDGIPSDIDRPKEKMEVKNNRNFNTPGWGIDTYGEMFSPRQLYTLQAFVRNFNAIKQQLQPNDYNKALLTFLAIWIDRIVIANTSFGVWDVTRETLVRVMNRQAIPMVLDFPESNPFCGRTGSARNQLEWVLRYIEDESSNPFPSTFSNASSGEKQQFEPKSITTVVTDPPYYDTIAYADISDFFYVWLKRTLGDIYPLNFSTPQTPKAEECTALKHHHNGSVEEAKQHFEHKLTQIFDAIETQTSDIVSIMFAHQSTEAWTTLCNSILNARMNITASWPMDTEMTGALKTDKGFLESSVTVSCRPSKRKDIGDYREVRHNIEQKVKDEVEKLYALGFRGADLLTACFGQATGEFGNYKSVEKSDGTPVSLSELLELARNTAFNAFINGVPDEPYTRFYIGWLYINGAGECDHDDVNKYTRVGINIDLKDVEKEHLIINKGNKTRLATAIEHLGSWENVGTHIDDAPITQAHRAMQLNKADDRKRLLKFVKEIAPEENATLWRLLATLKELLPNGEDLEETKNLLQNAATLRRDSKTLDDKKPLQGEIFDNHN